MAIMATLDPLVGTLGLSTLLRSSGTPSQDPPGGLQLGCLLGGPLGYQEAPAGAQELTCSEHRSCWSWPVGSLVGCWVVQTLSQKDTSPW